MKAADSHNSIELTAPPQPPAAYRSKGTEELRRGNKFRRVRLDHQFRPPLVRAPCSPPCPGPFHARFLMASFLPANAPQELQRELSAASGLRAKSLPRPNPAPALHRMAPP